MKRIRMLVLFFTIFIITGCVKYELEMEMRTDKSFEITFINSISSEYASLSDSDETKKQYENLGYTVSEYEDTSYKGLKITKEYDSIDLISSANCSTVELTKLLDIDSSEVILFNYQKTGTLTTYKANFTYDLTEKLDSDATTDSEISTDDIDYSEYADSMKFKYTISLPKNSKIVSNNADSVSQDGYTLTWNMKYGEKKNIDFVFTIDDNDVTDAVVKKEDTTSTTDDKQTDNSTTSSSSPPQNISPISYIITFVLIAAVIVVIPFLKRKIGQKNRKPSSNDYSALYHSKPPTDYIDKKKNS